MVILYFKYSSVEHEVDVLEKDEVIIDSVIPQLQEKPVSEDTVCLMHTSENKTEDLENQNSSSGDKFVEDFTDDVKAYSNDTIFSSTPLPTNQTEVILEKDTAF